jgi:hypothetical protein
LLVAAASPACTSLLLKGSEFITALKNTFQRHGEIFTRAKEELATILTAAFLSGRGASPPLSALPVFQGREVTFFPPHRCSL